MKKLIVLLAALVALPAHALSVFATTPEWAALAREIGGDKVDAFAATSALQDPHRVEARPSLIARARRADLVVATGAELEIGWLPVVLRESGNGRVQPGLPGYFEAARSLRLREVPAALDRAAGDVHPQGNPHVVTDPRHILAVAEALASRLAEVDPANAAAYRAGGAAFAGRWRAAMAGWEQRAAPLRGLPVAVQHKNFSYLLDWLGMKEVATLEPKPGVDPSAAYLSRLLAQTAANRPRLVLRAAYNGAQAADWFAAQAQVPEVVLPYTVGGSEKAKDLFSLFDDTVERLLGALK